MQHLTETLLVLVATIALGAATVSVAAISGSPSAPVSAWPTSSPSPTPSARPGYP